MDNTGYVALTRQSGLMREMTVIANNVANLATAGYRKEGVTFAEHVDRLEGDAPSLSMAAGVARVLSPRQGALEPTGGAFDLAIEGDGFFLLETPEGEALTRAGAFTPGPGGELVNPDGLRLLDAGGAPVFVPPDAGSVSVARDGTLSVDGVPQAQIGLWSPAPGDPMDRRAGTVFALAEPPVPVEAPTILQRHLEASNVDSVAEITRMIQVQRAYELGQSFLDKEDARVRAVLDTIGR